MLGGLLSFIKDLFTAEEVHDEHTMGDASKCPFLNPGLNKVQESVTEITAKYPEFDKVFEKFDPKTDIIVVPAEYIVDFDDIYKAKLDSLGDRLIVFPEGFLVKNNVAVVKTGYYSYNINYGTKKTT
jgi:hypothetical protein